MGYTEPRDTLKPQSRSLTRAVDSLVEELQAVEWYQQRVDVEEDAELREILAHNRDEEKEHAAMLLEWLRRHDTKFAGELKGYLFTNGNLLHIEGQAT